VLLRCTKKLLVVLGPGFVVESAAVVDPQDWYANLVYFGGRKCLLLTQAGTCGLGNAMQCADLRW
jgi:Domain of unknown function (DUF6933)